MAAALLVGAEGSLGREARTAGATLSSDPFNGFDLSHAIIPRSEILSGGPPRDGIPAIDRPTFIVTDAVTFLQDDDRVVSLTIDRETRAYPIRILTWHEIVNDQIGSKPVAVTYCPLCGTAMVFNRRVNGLTLTFGVSGLLYQSDVLMYDRQTESLWSQLGMRSVAGNLANTVLELVTSEIMSWKAWKRNYPNGHVLSQETGFTRDYSQNAYEEYQLSPETLFPVPQHRLELPRKAWIVGILVGREAKAYSLDALRRHGTIPDQVGNIRVEVSYDAEAGHPSVRAMDSGQVIPHVLGYWFAWQAFYPKTQLWGR